MKLQVVKLNCRPGSQFHLGENISFRDAVLHTSSNHIHSDTLYSALVNVASKFGIADPKNILKDCIISSVFYAITKDDNIIYFLPRINVPLYGMDNFKEIKKIAFVSPNVYKTGIPVRYWLDQPDFVLGKNWIATKSDFEHWNIDFESLKKIELFQLMNRPQVKVHSNQNRSNFYQSENLHIADNSHIDNDIKVSFYFLIKGEMDDVLQKLIFDWLPLEGIGGQISTGSGQITSAEPMSAEVFNISEDGNCMINLSLLSPVQEDDLQRAYYRTKKRGGRSVGNSLFLKELLMIEEGALFENEVNGTIQDLTPTTYPIEGEIFYRYGKSFLLNLPETLKA